LSANIKRWLKKGVLISLKNGLYVTKEYVQSLPDKQSYFEFIACILKMPSYLSSEYVMQKYSMLTEAVFSITSITRKKTNLYINSLGTFHYSNIKKELFTGYRILNRNGFEIKEATKAKALFDFLYLRLRRVAEINKEMVESFRLNLYEFSQTDFKEFDKYLELSGLRKLKNLTFILKELKNDF